MRYLNIFVVLFLPFITAQAQDDFFEPSSSLGGYGELHYNNNQTKDTKTLDFHRFVLFYGYQWTEKWSFYSEVELEHNYVKSGQGELELEQAYVDYHPTDIFGFRAGVVLPSVGLINENHEPPLFLSVERPDYAKNIIPTTWFGNGASVYGYEKGFSYKATVMEGLNGDKFSAGSGIRGGRLKGYKSNAEKLLYNFRLNYEGLAGTIVGASFTLNDAYTSTDDFIGVSIFEVHARHYRNTIYTAFEYGQISYDGGDLKKSQGYYVDLGYNVGSILQKQTEIIPWFRFTDYNPANETVLGVDSEKANHVSKWMVGLTVKPIPMIAIKIDYGQSTIELGDEKTKILNIGVGYTF